MVSTLKVEHDAEVQALHEAQDKAHDKVKSLTNEVEKMRRQIEIERQQTVSIHKRLPSDIKRSPVTAVDQVRFDSPIHAQQRQSLQEQLDEMTRLLQNKDEDLVEIASLVDKLNQELKRVEERTQRILRENEDMINKMKAEHDAEIQALHKHRIWSNYIKPLTNEVGKVYDNLRLKDSSLS